jgi:diguanylate cyclase (GGDEF)-like protein
MAGPVTPAGEGSFTGLAQAGWLGWGGRWSSGGTPPRWAAAGLAVLLTAALFLVLRGSPRAAVVLLLPPALTLFAALWVGRKSPAASVPAVMPLLENIQLPMVLLDRQARILAVNNAFTRELGFQAMGQGGIGLRDLLSQRHGTGGLKPLWGDALGKGRWEGQAWLRRRDGSAFAAWLCLSALPAAGGTEGPAVIGTVCNISTLRQHDQQLRHLAFHDPLTGLPNRRLLTRDLTRAIARARRHQQGLAVMFIDLDHFKWINDSQGHAVGDRVLAEVAARLQQTVRSGDALARLGGDEFMLVLEDMSSRHDAAAMARKAIAAIAQPIDVEGRSVSVSASIGIALFPDAGQDAASLMHAADLAMYRAKGHGRQTFAFSLAGPAAALDSQGEGVTESGAPLA